MSAARRLAIVGGGPAGLMAAETARAAGLVVDVYDAKGSVGRKFLIAGKGGLNLTHSDPPELFASRYRERADVVAPWLREFGPEHLREWARGFGVDTFVGSSGRVFPADLKAAPLLRGWVRRLREQGVDFHVHHRWTGWGKDGALAFETKDRGRVFVQADAVLFALGGGSWPELGSDGAWVAPLREAGIEIATLAPSNCGFDVPWTEHFSSRFAGQPLKQVAIRCDAAGIRHALRGEFVVTSTGVEGSLVYAVSAPLRDAIAREGEVLVHLDLAPDRTLERLRADLAKEDRGRSLSERLRRRAGIDGVKAGLVYECLPKATRDDGATLATGIKSLPIRLQRPRPMAEAISTAGGVSFDALTVNLMAKTRPGVFFAGEMLDWEAPTGGYLLTACFASGKIAGRAAAEWLLA